MKKFLSLSHREVRKLDLPTIDKEIELVKKQIDFAINEDRVQNGRKVSLVGKNEIVNEYLYDSEEETVKMDEMEESSLTP